MGASQLLFHWLYSIAAVPTAAGALGELRSAAGHLGSAAHAAHLGSAAHAGHLGSAAHAGHLGSAAHAGHLGSAAHAGHLGSGSLAGLPVPAVADDALSTLSTAMVLAHVLAAVGTVLVLRRGELLAARVAELAVGLVLRSPGARLARWIPTVPVRRVAVSAVWVSRRLDEVLLASQRLRGPPEFALAA
ncbi:hypothetical protein ACFFX0_13180 [Citricoccus parietis]|uniref:Uncharacterized protein n=1 Tax=Citricoccus parietis TaxID=592307 RepID=A0ABV5FZJ8_9MICC